MTATFTPDGKLQFDFHDCLRSLSAEQRLQCIEDLSCDEEILKHVTDQLVDNYTAGGYSGGSIITAPADSARGTALDHALRRLAKASSTIAERQINKLEQALTRSEKRVRELEEAEAERRRSRDSIYH